MADKKESKILTFAEETRKKYLEGAKAQYDTVGTTYGPRGMNASLEKGFGRPVITRDGVTVSRDTFFSDRLKNKGAQYLMEAAENTNRIAGDGTSATTVLAYHLLKNSIQLVNSGIHPMEVSDILVKDSYKLLEALEKLVIPVKDNQLKEVASVSAGDPLIGQLIAEAILYVGQDGGILTEKAPITEIEREYIDGYYLQSGFTALQAGKKEIIDPYVIVSSKRLSSSADAIEILTRTAEAKGLQPGQIPRMLFIGNIEDAAYQTIVNSINQGTIDAVIIKTPPMYGELGKYLLEDIAIYANCQPITENTNLKQFDLRYIGSVDKVQANKSESTIFADNSREAVKTRVKVIKDQIKTESVDAVSEKLRDRVAKLEGKIAIFKIGGVTDTQKEEVEFRIEDAINSTRHAYSEGVVAGGGITLLELSKLDISKTTSEALQATFKKLLENANLPAELKLDEALKAPKGQGYNLRQGSELIDVVKEGIIDPYIVVKEVIKNALGTVSEVIKIGIDVSFEDTEK